MSAGAQQRATVRVASMPMWRMRLTRELPRCLVSVAAVAGLVASARYTIAPPRTVAAGSSGAQAQLALSADLPDVREPALVALVRRVLSGYLAKSPSGVTADLSPGASVSPPVVRLQLQAVGRLQWGWREGWVLASVRALDSRGVTHTLTCELEVHRVEGRWEVAAIQSNPDG
jgi:hypothetical protein